jgi:hypothetical protein
MTANTPDPARGGAAGSGRHQKRLASDSSWLPSPAHHAQDKNCAVRHLRFVAPPPPPCPRRIDVRIAASNGRAPHGRSRALKLTESDLAWLIEAAERLERA